MQDRSVSKKVVVVNPLGVHLRPADLIAKTVMKFSSTVKVACNSQEVDGRSIIELLMLSAKQGTEIVFTAQGDDAEAACDALVELVTQGFGEME
jgi:phosphocarrier protein HPr